MGMSERIDRVLDDLVKSGAAPGVVAMVVNDHGSLYSGAAGTKGVGRNEPMTSRHDVLVCVDDEGARRHRRHAAHRAGTP